VCREEARVLLGAELKKILLKSLLPFSVLLELKLLNLSAAAATFIRAASAASSKRQLEVEAATAAFKQVLVISTVGDLDVVGVIEPDEDVEEHEDEVAATVHCMGGNGRLSAGGGS
jgi:hypothetical protein